MKRADVELKDQTTLHNGFFRMEKYSFRHRLYGGGWSPVLEREIMERDPVAAVIPYDPVRDEVVLIEQFRGGMFAAGDPAPWSIEVVAGIVENGETLEEMVVREAKEEANCDIARMEKILDFYPSPGGCSECVAVYCGQVSTENTGGFFGNAAEGEDIRVFAEPVDLALERIKSGSITTSIGIIAVQWLALNREDLRRRWG